MCDYTVRLHCNFVILKNNIYYRSTGDQCSRALQAGYIGPQCLSIVSDQLAALRIANMRVIHTCRFRVAVFSTSHACCFGFDYRSIASKLKSTVCSLLLLEKAERLSIDWLDVAYRLVFPLRHVALLQLYIITHPSKTRLQNVAVALAAMSMNAASLSETSFTHVKTLVNLTQAYIFSLSH